MEFCQNGLWKLYEGQQDHCWYLWAASYLIQPEAKIVTKTQLTTQQVHSLLFRIYRGATAISCVTFTRVAGKHETVRMNDAW